MIAGVVEIVGGFLVLAGLCSMVAAAAMVSVALAVLVAGGFLALLGVVVAYTAVQLEKAAAARRSARPGAAS